MISPLFTTIVLVAGFIFIFMKITSQKPDDAVRSFHEKERRANNTLKKPLDDLNFINFPFDAIPSPEPAVNEKCASLLEDLNKLRDKKIVDLTGISNTDLKLMYGAANLPILSEYDQNFTSLCTILNELGSEYNAAGSLDEAVTVFNAAVEAGTDMSGSYTTLAQIYAQRGLYVEIQRLINRAGNIRSLTRNMIINKLQDILDSQTSAVIKLSGDDADESSPSDPSSPSDSILPADILDILETVPYRSDDQT